MIAINGDEKLDSENSQLYQKASMSSLTLTLFHIGGGGMFLTTAPKRLGGRRRNLVTFNINLFSIKKLFLGSLGYPVLPWQQVCQGY